MGRGYAPVPRIILDYPDNPKKPISKREALWLLFMKATYDEQTIKGVKLRRGQLFITIKGLARECHWSRSKAQRFLKNLEKESGAAWAIEQEIMNYSTVDPMKKPRQRGVRITFIYFDEICGEGQK